MRRVRPSRRSDVMRWPLKMLEIGVPLDARLLISVGELSVRKNHRVVVQALQVLPDDYWYAIVASSRKNRFPGTGPAA